jgi:hypothetical protein
VDDALAFTFHSGGLVGHGGGASRWVPANTFRNAMRYHSGGTVGLQPNEMPIIAQKGERIQSLKEVAAMGQAQGQQHIQVINGIDHEDIVRKGLGAPSNTKVILNMIRANKGAVRTALA